MNRCERAIFVVKPDGVSRKIGKHQLPDLIDALLRSSGIQICEKTSLDLTEEDVRSMYPVLDIPDLIYGEAWKDDLVKHLTSSEVIAYRLLGTEAEKRAKIVKKHLRDALADPTTQRGKVVENIAHVADRTDYEVTSRIFKFES